MPTDCMSNMSNLQYVKATDNHNQEVGNNMRIATLKARSVKNKDHFIVQQLHETDVDLAVITETWLKDTDTDKACVIRSCLLMTMTPDVHFSTCLLQVCDNKCHQIQVCMSIYLLDAIYCHVDDWPDAYYRGCTSYTYVMYKYKP